MWSASDSAWPTPRAEYPQRPSRLDRFTTVIDDMPIADLDAPRKQLHTATRIFDRLLREHAASGISYGMVRQYVSVRRPQIRAEHGRAPVEAFFEGTPAFHVLGGVPAGKIRYDTLKAAVARVLGFSRARVEADRWTAFRSHHDLEAFYCQPGITGAHEKGRVEGQVGWFRRNHLVPIPEVRLPRRPQRARRPVRPGRRAPAHRGRAHTIGNAFDTE